MTDVEFLDQLDQLRAAGTAGEWATYWGDRIASGVLVTSPGGVQLDYPIGQMDDEDDRAVSGNADDLASPQADAALIVAAVNALPQLTTALRAVLQLAEDWEDDWHHSESASQIRSAITAALSPDEGTP